MHVTWMAQRDPGEWMALEEAAADGRTTSLLRPNRGGTASILCAEADMEEEARSKGTRTPPRHRHVSPYPE